MIDDTFLRQTAALQANLKMLESQQDALSDFQDMQALRQYKARLADYIEAHSKAGHLPPDPFHVIQQRLVAVSEFFTAADQEYQRLTSWKKNWLKGVPNISLSDIQSARTELSDLVAELPHIQQRLWQMLSALDWDTSSSTVDLHPELLACAQCVDGLILRSKEGSRHDLHQFAQGEGKLAKGVSAHLTAMGLRIEELTQQHAVHAQAIVDAEIHALNQDFRSSEQVFTGLGKARFSDLDYVKIETQLANLAVLFQKFNSFHSSFDEHLKKGEFQKVRVRLVQLGDLTLRPGSELEREATNLLREMESRLAIAQKAHKKRMVLRFVIISLITAGLGTFSLYAVKENAKAEEARVIALAKAEREAAEAKEKAEQEAAEAKAKAEQEAAEAKAKAEQEAAEAKAKAEQEAAEARAKLPTEIGAGRVGATLGVPLAGNLVMPFAFCPSGAFTMGSPSAEDGHSSDENQVSVTLSKAFWMAKTEVTQAQWRAVMGSDLSSFKGDDLPVEKVSWNDAQEFIKKVNDSGVIPEGWKVALPTEAQWEYACRAGETGPYSGGTIEQVAWYDGNSGSKTRPVGTKKPNAWGLYDMHGNVWEWCADRYNDSLSGGTDPSGPSSGVNRVNRGGSWNHNAAYCRAAYRNGNLPDNRSYYLGFRPALVPSE